jgi:hypothetical protein
MKLIALAAALTLGGTAIAQNVPQQSTSTATQTEDDPKGGYQPAAPLFSGGTPTPGAQVIFVPNPQTASEAYPAPAPLKHYPICKPGQFDNCRQRGG